MKAIKGIVTGTVQGVWFRKWVQQGCVPTGVSGYARNLPDGRVEVLLVGSTQQLDGCKPIVAKGSPNSRVEGVEWVELVEVPQVSGFHVL